MTRRTFNSEEDYLIAFEEYSDAIFRHCYLRVRSREIAKELTHDAFTRLWNFIAAGNVVDSMQRFLYRECHRLIEEKRAAGVVPAEPETAEDKNFATLATLAPQDECAVILHYVDGFSLLDIADIVGGSIKDHAAALLKGAHLLSLAS